MWTLTGVGFFRFFGIDLEEYETCCWAEVKVTRIFKNIHEEYLILAIERCLLYEASDQPRTRTSTSSSECEFHPNR